MIEYEGFWFIDGNRDTEVFGNLKVEADGRITLSICGCFGELKEMHKHKSFEIINGFTSNGKKITLINNLNIGQKLSFPGIPTNTYTSDYMIEGEMYSSIDKVIIKDISSRYTDLSKWIGKGPFNIEFNDIDKELKMVYKLPPRDIYKLKDYILKINFKMNTDSDRLTKFEVHQNTNIIFESEKEITLNEGLDKVYSFSKFLTLCIGEYINPYDLRATDINNKKLTIKIYKSEYAESSKRDLENILIPYHIIKDNFIECLNNWDDKNELLEPVIDYVVESHEKGFHIPMSFLKIVQALEAFSRRMRNNTVMKDEDHDKRITEIMDKLQDTEHKEWIEQRLKYSNEPNLGKRLDSIFKETEYLFKLSNRKRKYLVFKIVETRNYFTHFDKSKEDIIMNNDEIYYTSKYLLFILRALIMNELGVNKKIIKDKISESRDFDFIKSKI